MFDFSPFAIVSVAQTEILSPEMATYLFKEVFLPSSNGDIVIVSKGLTLK